MIAKEFRRDLHTPNLCHGGRGAPGQGNFMTPEIVAVFRRGLYVFEVSAGDFLDHRIYGVTVWGPGGRRLDPDPSAGGFRSLDEAWAHVDAVVAVPKES